MYHIAQPLHGCVLDLFIIKYKIAARTSPDICLCPVLSLVHCSVLCYHLEHGYALYYNWYTAVSCTIIWYMAMPCTITATLYIVSCAITWYLAMPCTITGAL
jgi:hypothetical protein